MVFMNEAPKPRNIDFEVHRNMLQFERKWMRRGGLAQVILGTTVGIVGVIMIVLFLYTFSLPSLQEGNLWFILVLLIIFTIGFPLSLIPAGSKTIRKAEQPIVDTEVEARRQAERAQLFTQAQGQLPEEYTPRGHRFARLLGGGMTIFFAIVLIVFWGQPFPLWLFGLVFGIAGILIGLLLMIQPLVYNQRAASALQRQSAQMLRRRLASEEPLAAEDTPPADPE
jgi:MFS family permease